MKIVPAASLALAGGAALALKWYYSTAPADALGWILAPTVALVQAATGFAFVREAGTGWWSEELRYTIAPVCAGVNFFIAAFLSIAFALVREERHSPSALAKLAGAAVAAYGATIFANAARLSIALTLRANDVHAAGGESAHRTLGILVYLPVLFLVFELAQRAGTSRSVPHA